MDFGLMDSALYPELGYTPCVNGFAEAIPGDVNNTFRCRNVDLYHFLSHAELGSSASRGSSSWGWTSADGREFVAIGQYDGTAFAEITSEGKLVYLGRLPQFDSIGSNWREIRIVNDIVVIGSEAIKHGVQFFDMKKILDLDPANPKTFSQDELTGHWDELPVGRTHNIVVNHELNYAIAVGSVAGNETIRVRDPALMPCRGGLIFLDLTDPTNVTSPGCAAGDGYVHDAECLVYRGPDERYYGRDICYGYNEDTLTIYDVTDKVGNVTNIISISDFPGAEYIHQGVVNNETWQEYLFLDDEFDERDAKVGPMTQGLPTTHIFDIRDLENPVYTGNYAGKTRSIDHNQYITDGYLYQSNYGNGLNVLDISSVIEDPTGASICEAGFIDIHPEDDEREGGGSIEFVGSWSSYANFKSGFIFVHTIERGSFVVKMTSKECAPEPSCSADNCMRAMRASHIPDRLEESIEFCGNFTRRLESDVELVPAYAANACGGDTVSRVSSACGCIPPTVVPQLPRTTTRPAVPTALPT
jgi:choice-of-anchor B domain-containing protein